MPAITLLVPCYNAARFLPRLLDRARHFSYSQFKARFASLLFK